MEKSGERPRDVRQLHHGADLPQALRIDDLADLALQNNPALVAARGQRGVAQAQLTAAGILPNPSVSAAYGFLVSGPGTGASLTAGISEDLRALFTFSARRGAADQAAREVDASVVWQEWQTVGRARLLAVDLVEGNRQLRALRDDLALLEDRSRRGEISLSQGDSAIATVLPDVVAAADIHRQRDDLTLLQEARQRELAAFLGLAPDAPLALDEDLRLPPVDPAAVADSLASLADRRPDLVALQLGYAAQEERVRGAILAQFPLFTLGVAGGHDTSDIRSVGPQITFDLPLFDRNQGNIAIERATRQQLRDEFSARLTAAREEVLALLAAQAQLQAQYASRTSQLAELDRMCARAADALRAGDLDERAYVDIVAARNTRRLELLSMEQVLLEQQAAIATLTGAGMPAIAFTAAVP